jgi:NAD(P)-dependent dehydrogenase (short-subunit alcohol dehydrogenase family)
VHIVDVQEPDGDLDKEADDWEEWDKFHVHKADVRSWVDLRAVFESVRRVDLCFANAGITDADPSVVDGFYCDDDEDEDGKLQEPTQAYQIVEINLKGVLNTVKLARFFMRKEGVEGSIVITGSSGAYWPDQYVPIGSVTWGAVSTFLLCAPFLLAFLFSFFFLLFFSFASRAPD